MNTFLASDESGWDVLREQLAELRREGVDMFERIEVVEQELQRLESEGRRVGRVLTNWEDMQQMLLELFRRDQVGFGYVRVFAEMLHQIARERQHASSAVVGETNGAAKLTESAVRDIRRRRQEGETTRSLAAEYGVADGTVKDAARRRTWRHLP